MNLVKFALTGRVDGERRNYGEFFHFVSGDPVPWGRVEMPCVPFPGRYEVCVDRAPEFRELLEYLSEAACKVSRT